MKITLKQLQSLFACEEAEEKFKELFGDEVILTEDLIREHAMDFNLGWLLMQLEMPGNPYYGQADKWAPSTLEELRTGWAEIFIEWLKSKGELQ